MKALVMSLFLATSALSSALAEIISPVVRDPNLVGVWAAPAVALAVQTGVFWWRYRGVDGDEFMIYEEDGE